MIISNFKNVDLDILGSKCANLVKFDIKNTPKFICVTESSFDCDCLKKEEERKVLKHLKKNKLYAVRSSSNIEDLDKGSFAGMYDTYLNTKYEDIISTINKCYKSKNNTRVTEYANTLNINISDIKFSVIVQEMVNSQISGVINTINPLTNNPDEIVISCIKGIGEDLVNGSLDASNYYVSYNNIRVEGNDILSKKELNKVTKLSKMCQSKVNYFIDIEFAISNNKVYFLQARPIAPYSYININDNKTIYDNSNIIESYNNVVSPLTESFAKFIYKEVYTRTFKKANVRSKIIETITPQLDNMIEVIDNRLYYNLNSWYQLNSLFMSKNSKKAMEAMMGVSHSCQTMTKKFSLFDYLNVLISFLKCLKSLKRDSDSFSDRFTKKYSKVTRYDFDNYNIEMLHDYYINLKEDILDDFTIPVINDTICMFSLNNLKRKLKKAGYNVEGAISDLITNSSEVLSSKGASSLDEILNIIRQKYNDEFKNNPKEELYNKFYINKYDIDLYNKIDDYITMFGCRVSNELKLETITYSRYEIGFIELLKSYIVNELSSSYSKKDSQTIIKNKKILKNVYETRYYIANRERLRLYRTHVFQIVRNIFDRCGYILKNENVISDVRDIYYLSVDEVFSLNKSNLSSLIDKRKEQCQLSYNKNYPERIVTYGYNRLDIIESKNIDKTKSSNIYYGIGSNKGVIEGIVRVIDDINNYDLKKLNKNIIVFSYATDPGWVRVFPLIGGLIVERGSILSHASVVSREMGLKCVVSVSGISKVIKDGMKVKLDSNLGVVTLYEK